MPETLEERRKSCVGWIAVSLLLDQLFSDVLLRYESDDDMDVGVVFLPSRNDPQDLSSGHLMNCISLLRRECSTCGFAYRGSQN